MLRFGVIGTSWITRSFISGARLSGRMEPVAVCSRDAARGAAFAADFGDLTVFTSPEAMADSGIIDAVYIASPNSLHAAQSRIFLSRGISVLCEKPITVTPDELEELNALADQNGAIFLEALIGVHLPERQLLHQAVAKLGHVSLARIDFSQLSSKYPALCAGELPNIFNPRFATGGLMDLGIYCVFPVIDLFGMPDSITASAGFLETGADGYGNSVWQYPDKQVHLSYNKIGQSAIGSEIIGDEGTLVIPSISQLTHMRLIKKDGTVEMVSGAKDRPTQMSFEAADFARYVSGDKTGYEADRQLSLQISRVMYEMRQKAGITFLP